MAVIGPDSAFLVVLVGSIALGSFYRATARPASDPDWIQLGALFLVIAVPSLLQVTLFPALYDALRRDAHLIEHHVQWWRLVTALGVQDGGGAGALLNLASLAILLLISAPILSWRWVVGGFAVGALSGELAGLAWQHTGGGNSVGDMGICAAILVLILFDGVWFLRLAALAVVIVGATILFHKDIHGAAFVSSVLAMVVVRAGPDVADRHRVAMPS